MQKNRIKPAANQILEETYTASDRLDGCENRFQHGAFNDECACKVRARTIVFEQLMLLLNSDHLREYM